MCSHLHSGKGSQPRWSKRRGSSGDAGGGVEVMGSLGKENELDDRMESGQASRIRRRKVWSRFCYIGIV
jgi:hypothetical protein